MLPFPSHSFPHSRHPSSSLPPCGSPCPHSLACRPITTLKQWHPSQPPNFHASFQHAHSSHHTTPATQTIPNIPSPDLKSTRLKPLRREQRCIITQPSHGWQRTHSHHPQHHAACMSRHIQEPNERKQKKKGEEAREGRQPAFHHTIEPHCDSHRKRANGTRANERASERTNERAIEYMRRSHLVLQLRRRHCPTALTHS